MNKLTRKEKREIREWEKFRHPNIPQNYFHQLTGQEQEKLAELIEDPQLGPVNLNGMLQDPDPVVRGGWEPISKIQPLEEEEELDKYGLRRFWNTKTERKTKQITYKSF